MAKNASAFLNGGYKGPNSDAHYPSGKGIKVPTVSGLNKKVPAEQLSIKTIGKVAGAPNPTAKSEKKLDNDLSAKSLKTLDVHYRQ